jgi:hypothetical protein
MKNCNIVLISIFIVFALFLLINHVRVQREGFGPKWIRTRKNRLHRSVRRALKPYYDDYFKKLERFRRKWL